MQDASSATSTTTTTKTSRPTLNPALKDFWTTKADIKILKGGRASSKSWDAAGFCVYLACNYSMRFLCIRQFQSKIQESVYALLLVQIDRFDVRDQFDILKSSIVHKDTGTEFLFYGIHRSIAEIKGTENIDFCWIEEGEGLTQEQFDIISPTIRNEGSEILVVYNPRLASDYIETFVHDPDNGVIVRQINYDQNPFLSDTMLRKIHYLREHDPEDYEHVYLGVPRSDDDKVVIKRSWIEAAIGLDIEPEGAKRIGFDIADGGADKCATIYAHGSVVKDCSEWKAGEHELLQSCTRVWKEAIRIGAGVTYDSIGVGASAGAKFQELNEARKKQHYADTVSYKGFNAGGKVLHPNRAYSRGEHDRTTNKDHFANIKAQVWWQVADRFRNTYNHVHNGEEFAADELISIDAGLPNLGKLVKELSTPRRDFDSNGRVKVESKIDLARREVDSPNMADAFIMAFADVQATKALAW